MNEEDIDAFCRAMGPDGKGWRNLIEGKVKSTRQNAWLWPLSGTVSMAGPDQQDEGTRINSDTNTSNSAVTPTAKSQQRSKTRMSHNDANHADQIVLEVKKRFAGLLPLLAADMQAHVVMGVVLQHFQHQDESVTENWTGSVSAEAMSSWIFWSLTKLRDQGLFCGRPEYYGCAR